MLYSKVEFLKNMSLEHEPRTTKREKVKLIVVTELFLAIIFENRKIDSDHACEEALLKMNKNPFRIILSY